MTSPNFSSFRSLMDKWDAAKGLFKENDLCFFFKKDGVLYGGSEESRITFARMKNPESKEDRNWAKEATFTAYDLEKSQDGNKVMSVMGISDAEDLSLLDQEEAEKILKKKGKELPAIRDDDDNERKLGER